MRNVLDSEWPWLLAGFLLLTSSHKLSKLINNTSEIWFVCIQIFCNLSLKLKMHVVILKNFNCTYHWFILKTYHFYKKCVWNYGKYYGAQEPRYFSLDFFLNNYHCVILKPLYIYIYICIYNVKDLSSNTVILW